LTSGNVVVLVAFVTVLLFAVLLIIFRTRLASLLDTTAGTVPQRTPLEIPPIVRFARNFLLAVGVLGIILSVVILAIGLTVTS
jgi:hypothetical protein